MRKALALIGDIYASRYNKGVIPEEETLYGLGQVVAAYLAAHPNKMDLVAEKVVIEALKGAAEGIQAQKVFWETAYKAAEAYFLDPSRENGETLYLSLPDRQLPGLDPKGRSRLFYFFDGRLSILIKKFEAGDPYALDIGFRLINIADGGFAEVLFPGLGRALPGHPQLFLKKLLANLNKTDLDQLDSILYPISMGEIPEDDRSRTKYNELLRTRIVARIEALESVEDQDLIKTRDLCISTLKRIWAERAK